LERDLGWTSRVDPNSADRNASFDPDSEEVGTPCDHNAATAASRSCDQISPNLGALKVDGVQQNPVVIASHFPEQFIRTIRYRETASSEVSPDMRAEEHQAAVDRYLRLEDEIRMNLSVTKI
jgi:hypothetical protein